MLGSSLVMISEFYDALREAGASEKKVRLVAEAIAQYDERFNRLDVRSERLAGRIDFLQWMAGTDISLTAGVLWKLLSMKP